MKIKAIVSIVAAAFLLNLNAQAAKIDLNEVTDYVMNAFDQEGIFEDMSDSAIRNFETLVKIEVANELSNHDLNRLDLSEGAKEAFLKDTFSKIGGAIKSGFEKVKDVGGKVIKGVTSLAGKAMTLAKSVASQIGPLIVKFGPTLAQMAGKIKPEFADVANVIAQAIPGLTQQQAAGAVAMVQDSAVSDEDAANKALALLQQAAAAK